MIDLKEVSLHYANGTEGLHSLNLKVDDGEFCFITGRSGSGKSTLSRLLIGELKADSGQVYVNGYNMRQTTGQILAEARRTIGTVFQDFRLINAMTVSENLEFAMRCVGASAGTIAPRIRQVLELTGLERKEGCLPSELSGGEKQRVAIARAIINHPCMLIADEPTGNLDPALAADIMDLFVRINEQLGTTTLVVTHAQSLVDRHEKRVITLVDGRVVSDTHTCARAEKGGSLL